MNEGSAAVALEAASPGTASSRGEAEVRPIPAPQRVKNTLTKLGTFWGIGLLCVFLPVAHFFLVPLFFCLGLYFAARAAQAKEVVVSGSVPCPGCGLSCGVAPGLAQWPRSTVCEGCRRDLEIGPRAAESPAPPPDDSRV